MLCFDGDSAGLRAAYRAVDLAHAAAEARQEPEIRPAAAGPGPRRSLPLGRARGRRRSDRRRAPARRHAVGARNGRPLSSIRRSGARRWKRASTRSPSAIGDDAVRKYYRQDFNARLAAVLRAGAEAARQPQQPWRQGGGGQGALARQAARAQLRPAAQRPARARPAASPRPMSWSATRWRQARCIAATAPPCRGARRSSCRRPSTIPGCCTTTWRNSATLEFRHAEAERLKARADRHRRPSAPMPPRSTPKPCGRSLPPASFIELAERIAAAITTPSVWGAQPEAAPDDVLVTWQQLVALHRQWHSLLKELKDAEQALGQDASEANYLAVARRQGAPGADGRNGGPDRGLRRLFRSRRP